MLLFVKVAFSSFFQNVEKNSSFSMCTISRYWSNHVASSWPSSLTTLAISVSLHFYFKWVLFSFPNWRTSTRTYHLIYYIFNSFWMDDLVWINWFGELWTLKTFTLYPLNSEYVCIHTLYPNAVFLLITLYNYLNSPSFLDTFLMLAITVCLTAAASHHQKSACNFSYNTS